MIDNEEQDPTPPSENPFADYDWSGLYGDGQA